MMKGKKKGVIIIVALLLMIIIIAIYKITTTSNKPKTSVNDFRNIKELLSYYGCKYIETKKSSEDGYKKDVFLEFNILPVTEEGVSNKAKYEEIISSISAKMKSKNYRMIDEKNGIVVRANFSEQGTVSYIINDDINFFEHLQSKYSIENAKDKNITNFEINSKILSSLINNNWKTTNLNLGTKDSEIDKYDIYFDEGYKIRKINGRVYNIVFTNKYSEAVVNNLHTNNSFDKVREILGQATYEGKSGNTSIIGYKNENMYIFFSNDGISIYPNEEGRDSDKFAEIVTKLIEDNNQKEFLSKLTDVWPDYYRYSNTQNGIIIEYPLKGVKIDFTIGQKAKVIVYENYKGNITNDLSIEVVKEDKSIPATYINLKLDDNLLVQSENNRASFENRSRNPYVDEATIKTNSYAVYLNSEQNICSFYSRDRLNIDSYIQVAGLNNIYKLNDTKFVYSLSGKGIYLYNATLKSTSSIIESDDTFEIKNIVNNTIYYDNKSIIIE